MEILIQVVAPTFGKNAGSPREEQWERTEIGNMLKLLASRIEMGQPSGSISGDGGATLHWRTETPAAKPDGEEAA